MPHHDYRAKDGSTIERYFSIHDTIPRRIRENGKTYHHVITGGLLGVAEPEWDSTTYQFSDVEAKAIAKPGELDPWGGLHLRGKRRILEAESQLARLRNGRQDQRFDFGSVGRSRR